MTKTEYAQYLTSPHWKNKRQQAFEEYGNNCFICSIPRWLAEYAYDQDLHVHHQTYENLGNESIEDLSILCRRCHEIETFGRSDLKEAKHAICATCRSIHWDPRSEECVACSSLSSNELPAILRIEKHWQEVGFCLAWLMTFGDLKAVRLIKFLLSTMNKLAHRNIEVRFQ